MTETEKTKEEGDDKAEQAGEEVAASGGKLQGKKLKLIIAIVAIVVLAAGGVAFYLKAKSSSTSSPGSAQPVAAAQSHDSKDKAAEPKLSQPIYYDLDEFLVNLDKGDKQPNFLKMTVSLQLSSADLAEKVKARIPVIRDAFQVYLRELRGDDLQGSAGLYRLREELMLRINKIMAPDKVDDILFKEILIQ